MQALAGIAVMGTTLYGFLEGGFVGALTGLVVALGTSNGLAVAIADLGTGAAQRIGGVLAAVGCLTAGYAGGWQLGWLWGAGGYLAGTLIVFVLWSVLARLFDARQE